MREALFIKKNADKWKQYQESEALDPDETADRFITLIDDLSYAKTFYPRSKVTRWINGITATIYQNIYKNKKEKYTRIIDFWKFELPLLFRRYHRILAFTTLLFITFVITGYLSASSNPDFIRGILGDRYVDLTEDNISRGDPFGIYKDESPFSMFVHIAYNNIKVAFVTFLGGFTAGIFTLNIMWSTGIMIGSFHQFFALHGLGLQSVLIVWIHGTLEISAIVIAGAAGFIIADGILFPKTFTRLQSFKRAVKDAAKILICLVPFFIIAGFFESYLTYRLSSALNSGKDLLPAWISILILVASFILICWYFIYLPVKLHKKGYSIKKEGIVSRLYE